MSNKKLSDKQAKKVLLKWPNRTKLWPPPSGRGYWIQGQPRQANATGPRISSPGAKLFNTQPDGLWAHFQGDTSCDVVAIEVCGTIQNLNDKRSRYIPASHSLILRCPLDWLEEKITVQKGGKFPRWKAAGTFDTKPGQELMVPIRHLRVLYGIPNALYDEWSRQHTPTGYEFFSPHSSLHTYNSPAMQAFLRQMSSANHFRTKVKQ